MLRNYIKFYHYNKSNNLTFHLKTEIIVIIKTIVNIQNYLNKYKMNKKKNNKIKYCINHNINSKNNNNIRQR